MINIASSNARFVANKDDPAIEFFLGEANRARVHRLIVKHVYDRTNGQVKLGQQSDTELQTIMIHFLQKNYNKHLPVDELNRAVVNFSVDNILDNIAYYVQYIRDTTSSTGGGLLDAPMSSRESRERSNKPIF